MEASVLGAMLVAEPTLSRVIDDVGLVADDFYLDRHRVIFEAIHALYAASKPVDELSVTDALADRKVGRGPSRKAALEFVGGKHYVSELAAKVPAAGNAKHYAEIVRGHSRRRTIIAAAGLAADAAHDGTVNGEVEGLVQLLEAAKGEAGDLGTVRGSEVRLRVPRFLDAEEMLPTRSITVAFGPAGLGKTVYSLGQCAAVTRGRMAGLDGPKPVLISSLEDDPEAVLAPRLVAADANLDLVHFVTGLSLPSQVPALATKAKTIDAAFVLIDPIAAHLDPDIDSHRDASIRSALSPLAQVAMDLDLAVLVVAHPNKMTSATGLNRISGSGAFGNAARSVVVFGLDPGDPDGETGSRRIIAHMKCNVGRRAASVTAEIESVPVQTEDGEAQVPRLKITGFSDHSADDVLSSPTGEERSERDEARDFLMEQLASGPVRSSELKLGAEQAGLNWRTVERAKRDLDLKAKQTSDGWYWLPPGQTDFETRAPSW